MTPSSDNVRLSYTAWATALSDQGYTLSSQQFMDPQYDGLSDYNDNTHSINFNDYNSSDPAEMISYKGYYFEGSEFAFEITTLGI